MILSGQYQSGEKLPSVRDMAKDAGVNPNTMQRALASLDQEGLITTNRTIGRCITENEEIISSYRKTMAEKLIQNYLDNMKELGYTESEAFQFLYERWWHIENSRFQREFSLSNCKIVRKFIKMYHVEFLVISSIDDEKIKVIPKAVGYLSTQRGKNKWHF